MKTIGIIAEFNPFHKGHEYLIKKCKEKLNADYCVVVMSGDYVERGAPAIISKFDRARMALSCGADIVFELPVYYSLGSAEYFASGAISLLDRLGVVDYLCFGSENPDIESLNSIAEILSDEPQSYKDALGKYLKMGDSYPVSRKKALNDYFTLEKSDISSAYVDILESPNNILAVEYLKAIRRIKSKITPFTIKREGADYHSEGIEEISSAQGIRNMIFSNSETEKSLIKAQLPSASAAFFTEYAGKYLDSNDFSDFLYYKLISDKNSGYTKYLDVNNDLSNRILGVLESYTNFDSFCNSLKTRNLTYTRISRCLLHILLNITQENMDSYKLDGFTCYGRILGSQKESSALLSMIQKKGTLPILHRLKDAKEFLSPLEFALFEETLSATTIYNRVAQNNIKSEYRLKPVIL
ncbi:Predicted nucleotidyltransferase [Butyrivibrio proteoclasticus]|uniref:tRNA(Met) cytidine acetate ligase n=1 Tax=Butyrivibrio proteoclasticus TaxID=43305 RepID=A0A1I5U1M6_9FIRM|nr:nucleotidyltransferase [Butyrivibrio proteoclasticus]SFP89183.1 Predicted nucleotidyltransferase [Butyrivibrio proteoclasticus]